MSNIYALIVAAPKEAGKFCKENSGWSLREVRARYRMTNPKDERLRTEKISGCFSMVTWSL